MRIHRVRVREGGHGTRTGDVGWKTRRRNLTLWSTRIASWLVSGSLCVLGNVKLVQQGLMVVLIPLLNLLREPHGELVRWKASVRHACSGVGFVSLA